MVVKAQVTKSKKRLLITGSTGFVGRNFILRSPYLAEYDVKIVHRDRVPIRSELKKFDVLQADLLNRRDCFDICADADVVIHLAGVMMTSASRKNKDIEPLNENICLHLNMAEAASHASVEKYIWMSSTTGYPNLEKAVSEDFFQLGAVPSRYNTVGEMYRFLEKMVSHCFDGSSTNVVTLRPTGIFGEYDDFELETGHVLPVLINRCMTGNVPRKLYADKVECRDWIYIGNFINALNSVLKLEESTTALNIGYGHTTSMYDLHRLILKLTEFSGQSDVIDGKYDPDSAINRNIDCSKSFKKLGNYNNFSLEQGLQKTISWFNERQ